MEKGNEKHKPKDDLSGEIFGLLEVLEFTNMKDVHGVYLYKCECMACGKICYVRGCDLRNDKRKSCGCKKARDILRGWHSPNEDCLSYISENKCDAVTEMMCVTRGKCKFYKSKKDLD